MSEREGERERERERRREGWNKNVRDKFRKKEC